VAIPRNPSFVFLILFSLLTTNLFPLPYVIPVTLCHSRESGNLSFFSVFVGGGFIRPVFVTGLMNQAPTLTGETTILHFRAYAIHPSSIPYFPMSLRAPFSVRGNPKQGKCSINSLLILTYLSDERQLIALV